MNRNDFKKLVAGGLVCLLTFCSCSMGGGESYVLLTEENRDDVSWTKAKVWDYEPAEKVYYDILGEDVMPIVGYWGPYREATYQGTSIPSLRTDEMWQLVKSTGVNLVTQNNDIYSDTPETVLQTLDFAAKYGLGYFVKDNALFLLQRGEKDSRGYFTDGSSIYGLQSDFDERLKEYVNHSGFAGLDLVDEPSWSMLKDGSDSNVGKVTSMYWSALETNGKTNKAPWLNLFPSGMVTNEGGDYCEYLDQAAQMLGYISYDAYPFMWDKTDDLSVSHLYDNLNYVYDAARVNDVPFWAFVQCGGNWETWDEHTSCKPPTIEQVLWETNLFIAYGAKGIQYYTMCMPHSNFDYIQYGGETGMFDMFGNKTKYFYAAQMANTQISACDHILMNATQHGLICLGDLMGEAGKDYLRSLIPEGRFRELSKVSGDSPILIGCFDYFGKTALWVMNNSYYDTAEVRLEFDDKYCYEVIQRGESVQVVGRSFTLKFSPGEAALVALQ